MALAPGARFGPYEILSALGAGGMGEVWRARDAKLNRDVALKVLLPEVADNPERLARFRREAQILASLNHQNIGHIYGLEEADSAVALVLELVEGPTLADRIAQGPIPLDEALAIGRQIVEALEAAHEQGIVHRDLKPANIKVRPDGTVKVLDFGLAKALDPSTSTPSGAAMSNSPTMTSPALMTGAGVLLGTAAYMAPEQARGKAVDRRADIWAFGCVLYEMVTGRRAFDGEEVTDAIVSVVSKEPDWTPVPPQIRRLLQACLEKDPRRRLRDIGDVWRLLDDAAPVSTAAAVASRSKTLMIAAAGLVLLLLAALGGLGWTHFRERPPVRTAVHFQMTLLPGMVFRDGFAVSPDGKSVAFAASSRPGGVAQLWLRPLDSPDARALRGVENVSTGGLFWSPDSRFIGFASDNALRKVDVTSGVVQNITTVNGMRNGSFQGGDWNPDGVVLFAVAGLGILKVPDAGGTPTPVTAGPRHATPAWLPDGRHFLYSSQGVTEPVGVYLGVADRGPKEEQPQLLVRTPSGGVAYAAGSAPSEGLILIERDGRLTVQRFDAARLTLTGEESAQAEDIALSTVANRTFSATSNLLVYRTGGSAGLSVLRWFDRRGAQVGQEGEPARYGNIALSEDGRTLVVTRNDDNGSGGSAAGHTWVADLARGVFSRLNPGEAQETAEAISSDGHVAFTFSPSGIPLDLYVKRAGSVEQPELIVQSKDVKHANAFSHDGRFLIYDDHTETQRQDLWVVPTGGDHTPIPFLTTPADETSGQFSRDDRWIAYSSDESGRRDVYVRGFAPGRNPATAVGQWQISSAGGDKPRWSADGKELFYIALDGKMMAVPVKSGTTFEPGVPVPLFDTSTTGFFPYDVAPDGRFIINTVPESASQSFIHVVLNWQARLK